MQTQAASAFPVVRSHYGPFCIRSLQQVANLHGERVESSVEAFRPFTAAVPVELSEILRLAD